MNVIQYIGLESFGDRRSNHHRNALHPQRLDGWAQPRPNGRLSTERKCPLGLALIGLLLGPAFLRHEAAFGFFFQRVSELL
jgi:hypothetical protein